ncbi:hypothetical protein XENTR_v10021124 [Xenopus tropicalis]|nr:hypothetical protein XENTR_v10021124 [Xenopus tropicalis]
MIHFSPNFVTQLLNYLFLAFKLIHTLNFYKKARACYGVEYCFRYRNNILSADTVLISCNYITIWLFSQRYPIWCAIYMNLLCFICLHLFSCVFF